MAAIKVERLTDAPVGVDHEQTGLLAAECLDHLFPNPRIISPATHDANPIGYLEVAKVLRQCLVDVGVFVIRVPRLSSELDRHDPSRGRSHHDRACTEESTKLEHRTLGGSGEVEEQRERLLVKH